VKLLVSGATRDVERHPECGVLVTPHNGNSIEKIAESGRTWAADNSAFGAWDEEKFKRMLAKIGVANHSRLLWVACPDVVGNAEETVARFREWMPRIAESGLPVAFVGQDGLEAIQDQIEWDAFDAFFVGGSTEWKLGAGAERLCLEAKSRGKLVHVGRVNTSCRIRHCLEIGADTIDGTGFSKWPKRIPMGLKWIESHSQQGCLF
jgi:hypothetical protein